MDAMKISVMGFLRKQDNLVNLFLGAAVVALGIRSSSQQTEIEKLETNKSLLRAENKKMAVAMWDWRQHFYRLAESDPSAAPISLTRLRAIYGEEEPAVADQGLAPIADEEHTIVIS